MQKKLYSLYDSKAGTFAPPMVFPSDAVALREILAAVRNSPQIPPAQYPEDFVIFALALWSDVDGVKPLSTPESFGTVLQIMTADNLRRERAHTEAKEVVTDGNDEQA